MPVYAYTCRDCGTPLEVHQEFSDAALTECPVCGGRLRKQYGTIGVTFNGSGFYRTDSRNESGSGGSSNGSAKSDSGSGSSSSDSGSAKKSDSGSAKKSDSGAAKPAASTSGSSSTPAS